MNQVGYDLITSETGDGYVGADHTILLSFMLKILQNKHTLKKKYTVVYMWDREYLSH